MCDVSVPASFVRHDRTERSRELLTLTKCGPARQRVGIVCAIRSGARIEKHLEGKGAGRASIVRQWQVPQGRRPYLQACYHTRTFNVSANASAASLSSMACSARSSKSLTCAAVTRGSVKLAATSHRRRSGNSDALRSRISPADSFKLSSVTGRGPVPPEAAALIYVDRSQFEWHESAAVLQTLSAASVPPARQILSTAVISACIHNIPLYFLYQQRLCCR